MSKRATVGPDIKGVALCKSLDFLAQNAQWAGVQVTPIRGVLLEGEDQDFMG